MTTEEVKQAIIALAGMTVAASITPAILAGILEKMRSLSDSEKQSLKDYTDDFVRELREEIAKKQALLTSGVNIKTLNGQSLLGDGNITILEATGNEATKNYVDVLIAGIISEISKKQELLVSGINIRTVNGLSLLGDGNITIQGGEGQGGTTGTNDYTQLINKPSINGKLLIGDITLETGGVQLKQDDFVLQNAEGGGLDLIYGSKDGIIRLVHFWTADDLDPGLMSSEDKRNLDTLSLKVEKIENNQTTIDDVKEALDNLPEGTVVNIGSDDVIVRAPESAEETADFYICDRNGNVLAEFYDGHIKTKNFDSGNINGVGNNAEVVNVPTYWQSHLNSKISTINSKLRNIGRNGMGFAFLTDAHWDDNFKQSPKLIRHIINNTHIKHVVYGGDTIKEWTTKEDAIRQLQDFNNAFDGIDMINLVGNHDLNTNNQTDWSQILSEGDFYDIVCRDKEEVYNYADGMLAAFRDYDSQKVRMIFLNSTYPTEGVSNVDVFNIPQSQIDWMKERIGELNSEWTVIVFTHIGYFFNWAWDGDATNTVVKHPTLRQILDGIDSVTKNATIAGVVCGHAHFDNTPTTYTSGKSFPLIMTTCDSNQASQSYGEEIGRTRTQGTTSEQAFDVMLLDKVNRKIECIRIGVGSNRTFNF